MSKHEDGARRREAEDRERLRRKVEEARRRAGEVAKEMVERLTQKASPGRAEGDGPRERRDRERAERIIRKYAGGEGGRR